MKTPFILINVAVTASVIALAGCTTMDITANGDAAPVVNQHAKPTRMEQIKIYHDNAMPKHYTVVGRIAAQNYNIVGMTTSQMALMAELKKQAASLGANGIVHISSGLAQTTAEAIVVKK